MPPPLSVLSVSALTSLVKDLLETGLSQLIVEGEITGLRTTASKHLYFSLKDEKAVIKVVWFNWNSRGGGLLPEDGQKVRIQGRLSVYEPQGTYQLVVSSIEAVGLGDLLARIERLKRQLDAEGLFDPAKKKAVPLAPGTIGLVTSPTGAALQDMLRIFLQNAVTARIRIFPVLVQGAEAARQIAGMIELVSERGLADVMVVGRGGGSIEDLLPFSDELVLRAAAGSQVPVISAVGHEIDNPLLDLVADLRAPTPTAAAQHLARAWSVIRPGLGERKAELNQLVRAKLERTRLLLQDFRRDRWEDTLRRVVQPHYQRLDDAKEALLLAIQQRTRGLRQRLENQKTSLDALNPLAVLERGYALVTDARGSVVTDSTALKTGEELSIRFQRGRAVVLIKETANEEL